MNHRFWIKLYIKYVHLFITISLFMHKTEPFITYNIVNILSIMFTKKSLSMRESNNNVRKLESLIPRYNKPFAQSLHPQEKNKLRYVTMNFWFPLKHQLIRQIGSSKDIKRYFMTEKSKWWKNDQVSLTSSSQVFRFNLV